ncbi:hypothetical protein LU604_15915 [Erwinia tracheiphila]|uniref:Gp5/Type VI secretion system Vgr protein OB-fold domain-containing protein n=1 Tax=Erwinia tracheiphila TaxID=65700 RepID=A0A345CPH7_9GAMM|nr:hypothetical protein [Erwinia tracheiphila]AXF75344.1 hypothetical protein AV903_03265 [Erwinia tracheiphila]UIA82108.1 hypothetical protein LU604_15915 [Erwinia tracheiphila]UIA90704.1 hypothetical protein LU632_15470 [Erwinia tracheiphila]
MRSVITMRVDETELPVVSCKLVAELAACGRGFVTAVTSEDLTGRLVRIDLGWNDVVYRWLTGYVERSSAAENGGQRLFARELVGIMGKNWPVSLQHPTLRDVAENLHTTTGLIISLPAGVSYTDTAIPHFTHYGTGYQLLTSLGRVFSIPDYVWYQLPDGTVFVGSYADSRFAASPVEIPEEFIKNGAAGNSITLAVIPAIRPGVIVNNRRITQVQINNDEMTLTWTLLNSAGEKVHRTPEQRQIDKIYPELSAGLHLPRRARVTGASDNATLGDQSDPFRPRYAVNLQLLDENGSDAADTPEYCNVPLPVPLAGAEGGLYRFPPEGTIVELAFTEGRPDKPVIRQTMQDGHALPDIKPGEQLQQHRAGVSQRITQEGSWQRETDQTISETSAARTVTSDMETRTTNSRTTLIKSADNITVLGTARLMAGAVVHLSDGDYAIGTAGNMVIRCSTDRIGDIVRNDELTIGGNLTEKIAGIRSSAAAAHELLAPSVRLGSAEVNVLTLLIDTLEVLQQLADQTANHSHSNTGAPTNSAAIAAAGTAAANLNKKYAPFIA